MTALLNLIPRWLLAAMVVAFSISTGVLYAKLAHSQSETAQARQEASNLRATISENNAATARREADLQANVVRAQNESKKRETELRVAVDLARAESGRLRNATASLRDQLSRLSSDAVIDRATAIGAVLSQSAERYQLLAASCDRHVSDLRLMIDAWPKK